MVYPDFHTHTIYSDGKNTPTEMIERAIELGMPSIGISDHSYMVFNTEWCMKSRTMTEAYIAEINRLKNVYKGQIEILCGVEEDYYSSDDLSKFDYSIGSVHHVFKDGIMLEVDCSAAATDNIIDNLYCGDAYAYAEDYYLTVGDIIRKTGADIIGHFDLITKFNENVHRFDLNNARYKNAAISAIDALLPFGRPFEVNTGAISRGYRTSPYPSLELLKYINAKGGYIILSSDSHSVRTLNYRFEEAVDLVKSAGFGICRICLSPRG